LSRNQAKFSGAMGKAMLSKFEPESGGRKRFDRAAMRAKMVPALMAHTRQWFLLNVPGRHSWMRLHLLTEIAVPLRNSFRRFCSLHV
jgi:hypothetical protein